MDINYSATAQMLTALAALGALIASPIVTLKIARKQSEDLSTNSLLKVRSEVISKNRQEWINTLRSEISELVAEMTVYGSNSLCDVTLSTPEQTIAIATALTSRLNKITLLINPKEADHIELVSLLDQLYDAYQNMDKFPSIREEVIKLAQKILKDEWERVKVFT